MAIPSTSTANTGINTTSTATTTMIVAPVVRSLPMTMSLYENSNVPLSMTVTPFQPLGSASTSTTSTGTSTATPSPATNLSSSSSVSSLQLSVLTNIPKCSHCGAPHSSTITHERLRATASADVLNQQYEYGTNDDIDTNDTNNNNDYYNDDDDYRRHHHNTTTTTTTTTTTIATNIYFCRLCNKTFHHISHHDDPATTHQPSSTTTMMMGNGNTIHSDSTYGQQQQDDFEQNDQGTPQQQQSRRMELQRHATPKVRNTSTSTTTNHNQSTNNNHPHTNNQYQLPPLPPPPPPPPSKSEVFKQYPEVTQIFDLPLRLPQQQYNSNNNNNNKMTLYRMVSMTCPILWYICLDGGSVAIQSHQYWEQVANTIQACLQSAPSHVHISILIASQRDITVAAARNHNTKNTTDDLLEQQQQQQQQQKYLSIYDLHSNVPKVCNYSSDESSCTELEMIHHILYDEGTSPVPLIPPYRHNIHTAIRSLVDYPNTVRTATNNTMIGNTAAAVDRCPVGWVTEVLLTSYQYGAIHVGHRNTTTTTVGYNGNHENDDLVSSSSSSTPATIPKIVYAGMKVTFFLCDQPSGIGSSGRRHRTNSVTTTTGTTTLSPPIGERYTYHHPNPSRTTATITTTTEETELTPRQLQNQYFSHAQNSSSNKKNSTNSTAIVEYYADLGRECSDMAMGVDLILLYDSTDASSSSSPLYDYNNNGTRSNIDFALPIIQPLSERSGAAIPLLFDLATVEEQQQHNDHDGSKGNHTSNANASTDTSSTGMTQFQRELLSRTPWQSGRVYGAELRVRISPGYIVDPNTVSIIPNTVGPQLAPIYNEVGCIGPASFVNESSQLWRMGTTDPNTSYTFDLTMTPHTVIRDHITIDDGLVAETTGDDDDDNVITLYPVIQICCAYTTVVPETDKATGVVTYYTIRQMRITNRIVPFAYSVEALYATIDTEALAVVLYHRIALAIYQDGILAAATMTQQWLQSLLVCIYKSAMLQFKIEEEQRQHGLLEEPYGSTSLYQYDRKSHRYFYPGERLLFLEGELSAEDVLLAQGHERLRPIVLMVYLLLQCDAFRCSSDFYRPSYDARSAILSRMSCMTPTSLTRCIAPRIQLWESGMNVMEPIYDVLDLRSDAIQAAILECTSTSGSSGNVTSKGGRSSPGLILFLDTPDQIVVMDARYVNDTNLRNSSGSSNDNVKSTRHTTHDGNDPLVVGIGLQNAISDAANSYRVRPPIIFELHQSDTYGERTLLRLVDHLIEDTYHIASQSENFNEWKSQIAQDVQIDVDNIYSA